MVTFEGTDITGNDLKERGINIGKSVAITLTNMAHDSTPPIPKQTKTYNKYAKRHHSKSKW